MAFAASFSMAEATSASFVATIFASSEATVADCRCLLREMSLGAFYGKTTDARSAMAAIELAS